jgi:hypothetical protein
MPIYLLTPLSDNAAQASVVVAARIPASDFYALPSESGWLIAFPGTTIELSNHLGITGFPEGGHPSLYSVLLTSVGSYYGRGSSDMWEWLKTRFESAR